MNKARISPLRPIQQTQNLLSILTSRYKVNLKEAFKLLDKHWHFTS